MDKETSKTIAEKITSADKKIIFLVGSLQKLDVDQFIEEYNYSQRDFKYFLRKNQLDSESYSNLSPFQQRNLSIQLARWANDIAYKEQKPALLITKINIETELNYLTKGLLMQELLHLAKNDERLSLKLVFVIDTDKMELERQILPKVLKESKVIYF
ncbi:MAG: hypothetical protein GF308_03570 [Candidatus Heimdallarchaeota archaeon]|nr:hypothetical protein [Candidatus Heimdallarchaeota archaeon]